VLGASVSHMIANETIIKVVKFTVRISIQPVSQWNPHDPNVG
jgi:hypothetical protein